MARIIEAGRGHHPRPPGPHGRNPGRGRVGPFFSPAPHRRVRGRGTARRRQAVEGPQGRVPDPGLEQHPRVHDPLGIERGADGALRGDLDRRSCSASASAVFIVPSPCSAEIEPSRRMTMSCTTCAAAVAQRIVAGRVAARRRQDVVVDVAVADVAEGVDPHARPARLQRRAGRLDELGDARDRHGDVVLPGRALAFWAADWSSRSAQNAFACVSGLGDGGVLRSARPPAPPSSSRSIAASAAPGSPRGDLDQHVPGRPALQRLARGRGCGAAPARCPAAPISSKLSTAPPLSALARASSATASRGLFDAGDGDGARDQHAAAASAPRR